MYFNQVNDPIDVFSLSSQKFKVHSYVLFSYISSATYRHGGALRRTFQDQLFDDLSAIGLQLNMAVDAAQNRSEWLQRVNAFK